MALGESQCLRRDDVGTTKDIKTYLDPDTSDHIQAFVLDDDSGNQLGIPSNPLHVDVVNNVATAFDHGSNSAIGVAATQFIAASVPATLGVEVKAANDNAANVYVGNVDVTAATVDATDGMELGPGESILVRIDNVNKIYGISTLANQRVFWLVV